MTISSSATRNIPSFQKIHYVLRPRKQIERKIIIELIQDTARKLNLDISNYSYLGLGSIYYYDFILFHKFLNISDMTSLDDENCPNRFEFNKPFDFITFENLSTTDYLPFHPLNPEKNTIIWFDYDSNLIWYSPKPKKFRFSADIFDDISVVTKKSRQYDFFLVTVGCPIPKDIFKSTTTKDTFITNFKHLLSKKYHRTKNISEKNFPYIIQNVILNLIKNSEIGNSHKFRKLFSFYYHDTTPMYTLGGIFQLNQLTKKSLNNKFFLLDEDKITYINTPLLTYKEKLHLDQRIKFIYNGIQNKSDDEVEELITTNLGFELNCIDAKSYLEYYRYYPQYYEGII